MANKAFLVGINKYPGAPLAGCVNDVNDMAQFLVACGYYKPEEIRLLVDERATTKEILARLDWFVADTRPKDKRFFHYSGHGAQNATRDRKAEVDGLNEIICPVDFDWTIARMIMDKQFIAIFSKLPYGTIFNWISDSCHSGDLTRGLFNPHNRKGKLAIPRIYPHPVDVAWRNAIAKSKGHQKDKAFIGKKLDVGFISGCQSNQTSADTQMQGRPCGALSGYFLKIMRDASNRRLPETVVGAKITAVLTRDGYDQRPSVEGARATRPFQSV